MNYLTNYYKNRCEQLQEHINFLQNQLNEVADESDNNFVGPPRSLNYDLLRDDELVARIKQIPSLQKLRKEYNVYNSINDGKDSKLNKKLDDIFYKEKQLRDRILQKGTQRDIVDPRLRKYYDDTMHDENNTEIA